MTALAIILGTTLASALALIAWLVVRITDATDQSGDARVAQVATEAHGERTAYELEVTQKALAAANIRAGALEEELTNAISSSDVGAGVPAGDVHTRLLRIVDKWGQAASARDPLSAVGNEAVSADTAAGSPGPVVHPGDA